MLYIFKLNNLERYEIFENEKSKFLILRKPVLKRFS